MRVVTDVAVRGPSALLMSSSAWSWDSGVDVRTRCSGWCSPTTVSAAGTGRLSGVRTCAQRCRRRQFASEHLRIGRARGIQHPRVTRTFWRERPADPIPTPPLRHQSHRICDRRHDGSDCRSQRRRIARPPIDTDGDGKLTQAEHREVARRHRVSMRPRGRSRPAHAPRCRGAGACPGARAPAPRAAFPSLD